MSITVPYSKVREALALLGIDDPSTVRSVHMDYKEVTVTYLAGEKATLGKRGGLLLEEDRRRVYYDMPPHPFEDAVAHEADKAELYQPRTD